MATTVTKSNLLTESRQNVYDLIASTSNVVDPTVGSGEFRKWIYSREPDTKVADFKGYPFIIVYPARVDAGTRQTVNLKKRLLTFTVEVEVVTADVGYNDMSGKGLAHIDAISDDILETFNSTTNRITLSTNKLQMSRPDVTDVTIEALENTLVYRRSIIITFQSYKTVSS